MKRAFKCVSALILSVYCALGVSGCAGGYTLKYRDMTWEGEECCYVSHVEVSGGLGHPSLDVVIPQEVKGLPVRAVGEFAFESIPSDGYVNSLKLYNGLYEIGAHAFKYAKIKELEIPDTVKEIGESAFEGCTALKDLILGSGLQTIGLSAFGSVSRSLERLILSSENEYFRADGNCLVEIETGVLILGMKDSVIPTDGSVSVIGTAAFQECVNLQKLVLPQGVEHIRAFAFNECSRLESIVVPTSLQSVAIAAFDSCSRLNTVFYEGSEDEWSEIDIYRYYSNNVNFVNNVCFYSEYAQEGNFWHYDSAGNPVKW